LLEHPKEKKGNEQNWNYYYSLEKRGRKSAAPQFPSLRKKRRRKGRSLPLSREKRKRKREDFFFFRVGEA